MRQRLAELRGPATTPHPLDARALAALAANPGCRRRALLDGAGVDKLALAQALGSPAAFGQSQFAHQRGNTFEARVKADGGQALTRLLHERLRDGSPAPEPGTTTVPDLTAAGPQGRTARTALALREATAAGGWALLDHPMVSLDIAGSPAFLEPDAVVVHPDGSWTVIEIKSFPMVDGSADPAKVGAAARQAAVYALALDRVASLAGARVRHEVLLVCPKDFSNLPTAELVDVRKQLAVTRRQLARLTRIEEIAATLPDGLTFDLRLADDGRTVTRPAEELMAAVDAVDAAYAPECLSACELAAHCRARCRAAGGVESLGRGVRGELGGLTTVEAVLAAALGEASDADRPAPPTGDPAVDALRRAAALRAEALRAAPAAVATPGPASAPAPAPVPGPAAGPAAVPGPGTVPGPAQGAACR
ncbi:hypothetical protein ABZ547_04310 [Streptomyces sparsogenes]